MIVISHLQQRLCCVVLSVLAVICFVDGFASTSEVRADEATSTGRTELVARDCFLRLKQHAQVPARASGVLVAIDVEPGVSVMVDQVLATLDSDEEKLALRLAELDAQVASRKATESVAVDIAEAAIEEADKLIQQANTDLQVARRRAESDIAVRIGQAALTLAKEELKRAQASRDEFAPSVSDLELARKQHAVDKSQLEIEKAQYDRGIQTLLSDGSRSLLEQNQVAARRLELELKDARTAQAVSMLASERAQAALEMGQEKLDRRQIRSPLTGIVVEQMKQQGEWVESGEPVLRVIRIDKLLVDGYVDSNSLDQSDRGCLVVVEGSTRQGPVKVKGRVIFVSPEVDSVNRQVMVTAEIDNQALRLRPGQKVKMMVIPGT